MDAPTSVLERIPSPHEVKVQLARNQREAHLLKQLLKVAERKHELGNGEPRLQEAAENG